MALILPFLSIFLSFLIPFFFHSLYCMLTLKFASVLSGTIVDRILKHGIHMDYELLYCGIENWTHCSNSCLYLSIFCLSRLSWCHSFPRSCFC